MKYLYPVFTVILLLSLGTAGRAQDVQFSQFYATSLYMNPAFAGNTGYLRGMIHQRWQWPAANSSYNTTFLGVDNYYEKARSGVGAIFLYDRAVAASGASFTNYQAYGQYSYELPLQRTRKDFFKLRVGGQVGVLARQLGGAITMPSQFNDDDGFTGGSNSWDLMAQQTVVQPDVALRFRPLFRTDVVRGQWPPRQLSKDQPFQRQQ